MHITASRTSSGRVCDYPPPDCDFPPFGANLSLKSVNHGCDFPLEKYDIIPYRGSSRNFFFRDTMTALAKIWSFTTRSHHAHLRDWNTPTPFHLWVLESTITTSPQWWINWVQKSIHSPLPTVMGPGVHPPPHQYSGPGIIPSPEPNRGPGLSHSHPHTESGHFPS